MNSYGGGEIITYSLLRRILILFLMTSAVFYGLHLRYAAITQTEIDRPVRADALDYFNYANNLARWHVYSRQSDLELDAIAPEPDALRKPGFPFFASLFVSDTPEKSLRNTLIAQTGMQVVCFLLLTVAICRMLGDAWGLPAVFLLWSFPHFVSINTYYLSESLFTSLLALVIFFAWMFRTPDSIRLHGVLICGVLFGAASLTRPVILYFPIFLLVVALMFSHRNIKPVLAFTACALLPEGLWMLRNMLSINALSDPTLAINALYHGSFPYFMYKNDPATFGFPYRFDPDAERYYAGLGVTLGLIWQKFLAFPMEHIKWYLWGKVWFLWQWDIISGQGDIFIYPAVRSPYYYLPDMIVSHRIHSAVHGIWAVLGLLSSLAVLVRACLNKLEHHVLWAVLALFILYVVLIHMVIAPFPRYGIPFKIALLPLCAIGLRDSVKWAGTKTRI